MAGIVAIVGRPNVGKSTLFNRLVGRRSAIVNEESGVTRDRIYGLSDWNGTEFMVVDTGGIVSNSDDVFEAAIRRQAELAISECDLVLFVVDVLTGITDLDQEVARYLRTVGKPVMVVANKVDEYGRLADMYTFYSLGLGDPYGISAINGSGTGELLDALVNLLPHKELESREGIPRITFVGRPNAGKSSLVNALLGEERNIVTPIAGTTRDAINTLYDQFGFRFEMIDTAGLRKKSKVQDDLEYYSVLRAIRAISLSDVCVLVVDATRGFEGQDQTIFDLIRKQKKGVVIAVNKWDIVEKEPNITLKWQRYIKELIAPSDDVPIHFISALTKQRILKLLESVMQVYDNCSKRISTSQLNSVILPLIQATPPPSARGRYVRIKYVTQLPTGVPSFAFFCNLPQYVKAPYKRFLENTIRSQFDFCGAPMQIFMRKK